MAPRNASTDMSDRDLLIECVERLRGLTDTVQEHAATLYGDGGDDNPGLRVRTDRMEQKWKITAWATGIAGAFGITALLEALSRTLKGHP